MENKKNIINCTKLPNDVYPIINSYLELKDQKNFFIANYKELGEEEKKNIKENINKEIKIKEIKKLIQDCVQKINHFGTESFKINKKLVNCINNYPEITEKAFKEMKDKLSNIIKIYLDSYLSEELTLNSMKFVENFAKLQTINLSNNSLKKVQGIKNLHHLEILHLSNNKIEDVEEIYEWIFTSKHGISGKIQENSHLYNQMGITFLKLELDLENNNIKELNEEKIDKSLFRKLNLKGNPKLSKKLIEKLQIPPKNSDKYCFSGCYQQEL